jgi:hypothetical protein
VIDTAAVVENVRPGARFQWTVTPGRPALRFQLIGDATQNVIRRIDIYSGSKTEPFQRIDVDVDQAPPQGSTYFKMIDGRFNGQPDIALLTAWGATGNHWWAFWRFDLARGRFVEDDELNRLNPETVDEEKKILITRSRGGPCQSSEAQYQFRDGQFVQTEQTICDGRVDNDPNQACDCSTEHF